MLMAKSSKRPKKRVSTPVKRARSKTRGPIFTTEMGAGMVTAEDVAATFQHSTGTDIYVRLSVEVLRRWNYRCAITGEPFAPADPPHPFLEVTAIRSREAGGPLHVSNFFPLSKEAARAWKNGQIIVGDDFRMWGAFATIGSEILGRLVPLGHLTVPRRKDHRPALRHFRWYRNWILRSPRKTT